MPSSFTSRLRLEQQAAGENLNTWGAPKLNNVIARLDFAIAGRNAIVLTAGTYVLSASNGDDEARGAMLDFTGTAPASVTLPSVSKIYMARNGTSGAVTLTSGSGTSVILDPGIVALVACDGTNVFRFVPSFRTLQDLSISCSMRLRSRSVRGPASPFSEMGPSSSRRFSRRLIPITMLDGLTLLLSRRLIVRKVPRATGRGGFVTIRNASALGTHSR